METGYRELLGVKLGGYNNALLVIYPALVLVTAMFAAEEKIAYEPMDRRSRRVYPTRERPSRRAFQIKNPVPA